MLAIWVFLILYFWLFLSVLGVSCWGFWRDVLMGYKEGYDEVVIFYA